eukprot:1161623-Pelagomonas_calceolata.AAC.2
MNSSDENERRRACGANTNNKAYKGSQRKYSVLLHAMGSADKYAGGMHRITERTFSYHVSWELQTGVFGERVTARAFRFHSL